MIRGIGLPSHVAAWHAKTSFWLLLSRGGAPEFAASAPGVSEQRLAADGGNTPGPEWRPGGRIGLEGRQVVRRVLLRRNIVIDAETAHSWPPPSRRRSNPVRPPSGRAEGRVFLPLAASGCSDMAAATRLVWGS